jgi:hypothetical protein
VIWVFIIYLFILFFMFYCDQVLGMVVMEGCFYGYLSIVGMAEYGGFSMVFRFRFGR